MKDLKCGLKQCAHNKGYCCCAKDIEVNSYTDCLTYAPDAKKADNLFEAGEDFVKADYSVDTRVKCTAKCVFNSGDRCISNGITVMGEGNNEATCLTFIKS